MSDDNNNNDTTSTTSTTATSTSTTTNTNNKNNYTHFSNSVTAPALKSLRGECTCFYLIFTHQPFFFNDYNTKTAPQTCYATIQKILHVQIPVIIHLGIINNGRLYLIVPSGKFGSPTLMRHRSGKSSATHPY